MVCNSKKKTTDRPAIIITDVANLRTR